MKCWSGELVRWWSGWYNYVVSGEMGGRMGECWNGGVEWVVGWWNVGVGEWSGWWNGGMLEWRSGVGGGMVKCWNGGVGWVVGW